mmetsp:Transcript_97252/g.259717  ORF Transcript_97252/g.259717 Transcript_97252/m.259717 type:complete len:238 (+) Transcript_97252:456-1169(+)
MECSAEHCEGAGGSRSVSRLWSDVGLLRAVFCSIFHVLRADSVHGGSAPGLIWRSMAGHLFVCGSSRGRSGFFDQPFGSGEVAPAGSIARGRADGRPYCVPVPDFYGWFAAHLGHRRHPGRLPRCCRPRLVPSPEHGTNDGHHGVLQAVVFGSLTRLTLRIEAPSAHTPTARPPQRENWMGLETAGVGSAMFGLVARCCMGFLMLAVLGTCVALKYLRWPGPCLISDSGAGGDGRRT